jgi:enoyl-CoA hydratase/carnithine racemase
MKLASEIASKSPDAIRAGKKLLNASRLVTVAEGLKLEAELQKSIIGQPNQVEAVRANQEKRDPKFKDVR